MGGLVPRARRPLGAGIQWKQSVELDARLDVLVAVAVADSAIVYATLKAAVGLRIDPQPDCNGADLTLHRICATPERGASW